MTNIETIAANNAADLLNAHNSFEARFYTDYNDFIGRVIENTGAELWEIIEALDIIRNKARAEAFANDHRNA